MGKEGLVTASPRGLAALQQRGPGLERTVTEERGRPNGTPKNAIRNYRIAVTAEHVRNALT